MLALFENNYLLVFSNYNLYTYKHILHDFDFVIV